MFAGPWFVDICVISHIDGSENFLTENDVGLCAVNLDFRLIGFRLKWRLLYYEVYDHCLESFFHKCAHKLKMYRFQHIETPCSGNFGPSAPII